MSEDDTPRIAGGDAAHGRFEWHHADAGTIYADTLDDAIAHAKTRLDTHDPATSAQKCVHVARVGFNATPQEWRTGNADGKQDERPRIYYQNEAE